MHVRTSTVHRSTNSSIILNTHQLIHIVQFNLKYFDLLTQNKLRRHAQGGHIYNGQVYGIDICIVFYTSCVQFICILENLNFIVRRKCNARRLNKSQPFSILCRKQNMVFARKPLPYKMKPEIKVYDVRTRRSLLIMTCHSMTVLYKFVIKGFRMRAKGAILDLVNKIWM